MAAPRHSKIVTLEEAAAQIRDGSIVAIGGLSYFGAPMALVRALIRRKIRNLTVVTAAVTSVQADLLIAAGCVKKIISPYVALEELGLAPNFRRAAEKREVEVVEIGEAFLAFALKAAACGAPFAALPLPLAASDCARVNPLYRISRDPFTDQEVVCIPPIRPDWTLLHAQRADPFGNLLYTATAYMDDLLARASRRVFATCDEEIQHAEVRAKPAATTIPSLFVKGVTPLYGAARPTASFGFYGVDRKEIKRYAKASKTPESRQAYLDEFAGAGFDENTYLKRLGDPPPLPAEAQTGKAADLSAPPAKAEIIATVIAHCVRDGLFTAAGTGCWEVAAGLRLAQLTHAPNLSFTLGGTAALNPALAYLPLSLNSEEGVRNCEAVIRLEVLFDLELGGAFDMMFASGLQIDRYGNLNLVGSSPPGKPAFRGPGTVGLEFAPCVPETVAFFRYHTKQAFVERVDFVSGLGYGNGPGSRDRWGIEEKQGPKLVVTNLAVLDFCPDTQRMRLRSVHPGVTAEEVQANTGFDLIVSEQVPETPLPTPVELELLRTQIDRGGLLRTLVP